MGYPYKVAVKDIKRKLESRFKEINIKEERDNLYFDIGYGEKFVIFFLPLEKEFDPNLLLDYAPIEVFFESVRRLKEVKPPVGYRVRFLVSPEEKSFHSHIKKIGIDRVLLVVNLRETGIGNEKIVVNNLSSKILYKIDKTLKNHGLRTGKLKIKEGKFLHLPDVDVIQFSSYPNNYKRVLPKGLFDPKRRDYIVLLIFLLTKSVLER